MYIFLGRFEIPPRLGPRRLPPRSPGGGGQGRGDGGEVHRAKLPIQLSGQVNNALWSLKIREKLTGILTENYFFFSFWVHPPNSTLRGKNIKLEISPPLLSRESHHLLTHPYMVS